MELSLRTLLDKAKTKTGASVAGLMVDKFVQAYQVRKPLVYLSSPLTLGDRELNLQAHFEVFVELLDDGVVTPYAPLTNEIVHTLIPREYESWMRYDFEMIQHCDALFTFDAVLPGYTETRSDGRRREIEFAHSVGIPTFRDKQEMYRFFGANEEVN